MKTNDYKQERAIQLLFGQKIQKKLLRSREPPGSGASTKKIARDWLLLALARFLFPLFPGRRIPASALFFSGTNRGAPQASYLLFMVL
jgi:hypothetical protein